MSLFEGLLLHEIILMSLGIILFLVLIYIIIDYTKKNKPIKTLLAFFLVPIIMIGFSSIQKFSFGGLTAELKGQIKDIEDLESRNLRIPDKKIKEIAELSGEIEERLIVSSDNILNIAKANEIIGNTDKALDLVEEIPEDDPLQNEATELKEKLITPEVIKRSIWEHKTSDDEDAEAELEQRISIFKDRKDLSSDNLVLIAHANESLGDTSEAVKYADSALQINPRTPRARGLIKRMKRR